MDLNYKHKNKAFPSLLEMDIYWHGKIKFKQDNVL